MRDHRPDNFDIDTKMVAVKSPSKNRRLMNHYLLLAFAASLLFVTILVVNDPVTSSTSLMGVRAHSAPDVLTKPHLIYGTAWKKEATAGLVYDAVKTGFRYVDTACQPKHYNEAGVGNGWAHSLQGGIVWGAPHRGDAGERNGCAHSLQDGISVSGTPCTGDAGGDKS